MLRPLAPSSLEGNDESPPVRYHTMGDVDDPQAPGNDGRTADSWLPLALEVPFHFGSDGWLTEELPTGVATRSVLFLSDPRIPVQTVGGAKLWLPQGPYDPSVADLRDDVVTFTTEPLEVTGELLPGESWNFQWWYRDPNGGAHGFNLSDGLLIEVCP